MARMNRKWPQLNPKLIEKPTISKNAALDKSLDYQYLLEQGLAYLRGNTGDQWTDHNPHDPGITILEALAYALTDLGYRSCQPIEDILSSDPSIHDDFRKDFFRERAILPCHPLTINDLRKVAIDIEEIKNVWIERAHEADHTSDQAEQTIGFTEDQSQLTYQTPKPAPAPPGFIKGILNPQIEFEKQDWNQNIRDWPIEVDVDGGTQELLIQIAFPYWDEFIREWDYDHDIEEIKIQEHLDEEGNVTEDFTRIEKELSDKDYNHYSAYLEIKFTSNPTSLKNFLVRIKLRSDYTDRDSLETKLRKELVKVDGPISNLYVSNLLLIKEHVSGFYHHMHKFRNLGEDYFKVKAIRIQEIAVDAEIELSPDANPDEVMADLFFDLENFFSPWIYFHSLEEMMKSNEIGPDQLFEGPLLKHGFIRDDELNAVQRSNVIYVSDLIKIVMDLRPRGVIAVKDLSISNYVNNDLVTKPVVNCLVLVNEDSNQPKLSVERSRIRFTKNGIPVGEVDFQGLLDEKRIAAVRVRVERKDQLKIPSGRDLQLENYHSIQHHFPQHYGIGTRGLSKSVDDKRKAQAKQLKAYLLTYDQLFANYLSQLSSVRSLFSLNRLTDKTYFNQIPHQLPDIKSLIKPFQGLGIDWEEFIQDQSNEYYQTLSELESPQLFRKRRNRFLDHLLARVGEGFREYAFRNYSNDHLITEKVTFLQDYPYISANRSNSFDITDHSGEAFSGFEKRISGLLGLRRPEDYFEIYAEMGSDGKINYRFRVLDQNNQILLKSHSSFNGISEMSAVKNKVMLNAKTASRFNIFLSTEEGKFKTNLVDEGGEVIAKEDQSFDTQDEALAVRDQIIALFIESSKVQFLVIEHVLLRPRVRTATNEDRFLSIPNPENNDIVSDPYSFQVTILFPLIGRFQDDQFQKYSEEIIRTESPAHLKLNPFWVSVVKFGRVRNKLLEWRRLIADNSSSPSELSVALNQLVSEINPLYEE